jgi:DNA-binding beta-propeller fold protein YncE
VNVRALLLAAAIAIVAAPAAHAACPAPCPYSGVTAIGDRDGGQLRLPQAVAVDAAGRVYVGDQYTSAIQRFGSDGAFQRAFGRPGAGDGEFEAIVGLAIDPADGSIYAADAQRDRIQHFTADGDFIAGFGSGGSDAGQFQFAAGGPVEDPAQGGLAVGNGRLWVADAQNDRVQSFPLADVSGTSPTTATGSIIGAGLLDNPQGLWSSDFLYVADDLHNVIRVFALSDGALLQTIGLGGPGAAPGQFNGAWDVAADAAGHVYAVDDNNHRIQVFDRATGALLGSWGGFGRGPGQLEYPRALTLGPDGAIYVANTADGRVDNFTTAGAFLQSFGQDGRLPGQFISPGYLAASPDGGLGVPDIEGNRIEQFAPDNGLLATYGGVGTGPEQVKRPQGIAFDAAFTALVADTGNNRIVRRAFFGTPVSAVFGMPGAAPGQLDAPFGVAVAPDGSAYVADSRNDRVQRFAADGTPLASYGPTIGGQTLDVPRGVAISPTNGRLYVASSATQRVLVIDPASGTLVTSFGGFITPGGIAVDAAGRVYVTDVSRDRVQRFSPDGALEVTWGESGSGLGQFEAPLGISADCSGTVSVADRDNNRIQRFTLPDPKPTTCAPTPAKPAPPPPPAPETPLPVPNKPEPKPTPTLLLSVKTVRLTKALARRELRLSALCDRGCTLKLSATLAPKSGGRKRTPAPLVRTLPRGARRTIVLRLTRADVRMLRRALGRRTALRLVVTARATQPGTRSATVRRTLSARA